MFTAKRLVIRVSCAPIALASLLALQGCMATFAPPVQSTHYGAPGRLRPGEMELRAGAGLLLNGTGALAIDLADSLKLELAADVRLVDEPWGMGSAGLRYTLGGKQASTWWAVDFELGLGAGVGGVLDPEHGGQGSEGWQERFAFGTYTGLGFAFHPWDPLAFFVRGRLQGTMAECIPATLWYSAVGGIELTLWAVSLYVAGGVAGYLNERYEDYGFIGEAGLSVHF
jgi:hypothetical protein